MFSFFRKIRQKLFTTRAFRSYLLYALGEIILVVIGILIALQINNWNEFQKDRKREKMYLQSLHSDLKESQAELRRVISKTENVEKATIQLLSYNEDSVQMPPPAVFDSILLRTFGYTIAMTNEGTINDISGSGDLKIIQNDKLRRMIASWEAGFKMIREREDLLKKAFKENKDRMQRKIDMYEEFLMDGDTRRFVITNNEYRNGLMDLAAQSRLLNDLYKEKIKNIDTLIAITKNELKN